MDGWAWVRIGAISGFLAVAAGSFGAHGLKDRLKVLQSDTFQVASDKQKRLENFMTASRNEMYHALALMAVGIIALVGRPSVALSAAGWAFLVGTLLFSGSLYAYGLIGQRWLGMITPLGGVGFLIGWIALAIGAGGGSRP
ncbi:MAG: DUF423 domain-containing protein [Planctomycetaceae bacterium]|nr:DUF423 domain-containing protein [Planctomycetaceae bacterium]